MLLWIGMAKSGAGSREWSLWPQPRMSKMLPSPGKNLEIFNPGSGSGRGSTRTGPRLPYFKFEPRMLIGVDSGLGGQWACVVLGIPLFKYNIIHNFS